MANPEHPGVEEPLDLSPAEQKAVACAARGELCDFGEEDASKGEEWDSDRRIRAEVCAMRSMPSASLR